MNLEPESLTPMALDPLVDVCPPNGLVIASQECLMSPILLYSPTVQHFGKKNDFTPGGLVRASWLPTVDWLL
jgi:hypothetical protein